jgi:hypothetical protein
VGGQNSVAIALDAVGTTSLSLHYSTLSGYRPATAHNWVGLWTGEVSPYWAPAALATQTVPTDTNEGEIGFNGITLTINTTYTLVYFMGQATSTAAALLTFTTAP